MVNVCPGSTVVVLTSTELEGTSACAAGAIARNAVASAATEDRIVVLRQLRCIVVISPFRSGECRSDRCCVVLVDVRRCSVVAKPAFVTAIRTRRGTAVRTDASGRSSHPDAAAGRG